MWFVYLLICQDKSLYCGATNKLAKRFAEHQKGKGGRYTRSHKPTKIVYSEEFATKSAALKREAEIKKWPRKKKETLYNLGVKKIQINDLAIKNLVSGKFEKELPEIYALKNCVENSLWHNHQNVFSHTIKVLTNLENNLKKYPRVKKYLSQKENNVARRDILFLAALFHDIAKPITFIINSNQNTDCPNHNKIGATMAKQIFQRVDLNNKLIGKVCKIILHHNDLAIVIDLTDSMSDIKNKFAKLKKRFSNIWVELLLLSKSDTEGLDINKINLKRYHKRFLVHDFELTNLKI